MPVLNAIRKMTGKFSVALFCAMLASMAQPSAGQTTDQDLVNRLFPQNVLDDFEDQDPGATPNKQTAFLAADLNGTGSSEFLVAVYAVNDRNTMALVRVLHKEGGSAVLAGADCEDCTLVGEAPRIERIDVDRSGRPQFLVEVTTGQYNRATQAVFRWNGTALELVGPFETSSDGTRDLALREGQFVDLDGDGSLEAINLPDVSNTILADGDEAHQYIVYKLSGGVYARSDILFDVFQAYRASRNGRPDINFAVADPGQSHILTVANGDGRDRTAVSGAEIRLNGVLIAGPDRINQQTRTLRIPVTVSAHNTLSVTVTGEAFSSLYVGIGPEHPPTMSIEPAAASVRSGDRQQFTPRFSNTNNKSATWSVENAPGASLSKIGSIDENGLYTAPDSIPQAGTVIVRAFRDADVASTATATITLIRTVALYVTPAGATMSASETQQFAAIVSGAADTSVSWSIYPHLGFITTAGLYTAPPSIASEQRVTITATSNADRSKSAVAIVTLKPPPPRVAVTPSNTSVRPGQAQQFTAVVTNTNYTDVMWSISPQTGWVTYSGLYTAPEFASPQTVTVTATSAADLSVSASATISLTPNVSNAIAPPGGLAARAITPARIDLSWTAPGGQVAGYNVYRNGALAGSTVATSFSDLGLARSTSYVYTVSAYDAQGTNSPPSAGVTAATPAGEIAPGLVLSYSFDEGDGTVAHDSSGNGNNGVITSAAWSGDGKLGGALVFDGRSSWITTAGSPSLDLTVGMTLEAWVKPASLGGWRAVLARERPSGISWGLFANNYWPSGRLFIDNAQMVNANTRFTPDQWAHLAVTYDGATANLYLNGTLSGTLSKSGPLAFSPTSPFRIGGESIWREFFAGMIDEVRIYNRALSASEIRNDMLTAALAISPTVAALRASGTQQFTATVGGAAGPVLWSISPEVGSISPAGLYTAPVLVLSSQQVAIIAVSQLDPNNRAAAVLTLLPTVSPSITPPGAPVAIPVSLSQIDLSWTASSAPGGVAGYAILRNGTMVASTPATSFSDLGLVRGTAYAYTIVAYDAQGNTSNLSAPASATTLSGQSSPGLVAYYNFNEGSGQVLHDSSGNGNNGTITGAAWTGFGASGGALVFNGSGNWVEVPQSASLQLGAGMTLEAWVRPAALGGWANVVVNSPSPDASYGLYASSQGGSLPAATAAICGASCYATVSGTAPLALNAWTHLAAVYDGTTLSLYINGVKIAGRAQTGTPVPSSTSLFIGGSSYSAWSRYFNGAIDELRIYNRPLTAGEIGTDMGLPPASFAVVPTAVTLHASESRQFSANGPANWSLSPAVGTINASGLYTAPATVVSTQTITVKAVSQSNTAITATSTITLEPRLSQSLTAPLGLTATAVSSSEIDLSWTAASGGIVAGYYVLRNGVPVGTATSTTYADSGVACAGSNTYTVLAYDAAGYLSPQSSAINAAPLPPSPIPGLAAFYNFNEGAGATLRDCSVNGNDGAITAPNWSTAGKIGSALVSDGLSVVSVPYSTSLNLAAGMTLEAWVKPLSLTGSGSIGIIANKSGSSGFALAGVYYGSEGAPQLQLFLGARQGSTSMLTGSLSLNTWTHVAVTYDGNVVNLYINGTLLSSNLFNGGAIVTPSAPLTIGGGSLSSLIDDVRVYNSALTQVQIQNDMQNALNLFVGPPASTLRPSQSQQFSAAFNRQTGVGVTWSITPNLGAITSTGLYTAPANIQTKQTVTVTATSSDSSRAVSAVITLMPPVTVSLNPSTATLPAYGEQLFHATVLNSSNSAVNWSLSPNLGTIAANGYYLAPDSVAVETIVTLTAASQEDPTKSATARITLQPPTQVTISPGSVTLYANETARFTSSVAYAPYASVWWTLDPEVGSIDSSGIYTAPAIVPAPQTITVRATSEYDPGAVASASITLAPRTSPSITPPANLVATAVSPREIGLSWTASTGGVAGYAVFRDGVFVSIVSGTTYSDTGLMGARTYSYQVLAYDAAGYNSGRSNTAADVTLSGPVASFGFEEGAGAALNDSSGFGNDGSIEGATWTPSGKYGSALSFNGVTSWVTVPHSGALELTTNMTLEAWVKPASLAGGYRAVLVKERESDLSYALYASDGNAPSADVVTEAYYNLPGPAPIPLNTWTHLATTYDGQTRRLYVNGVEVASTPQTGKLAISPDPLRIGGDAIWGEHFSGLIDEVRVYNRALSASDIRNDMLSPVSALLAGVSVAVAPSAVTLTASATQQFTATMTNSDNPAVTWSTTPANVGIISASGLYTAPAAIATPQTVTVIATSVADPAKTATATVTLNLAGVVVILNPATVTLNPRQTQQFAVTVSGSSNAAVNWSVALGPRAPAGAPTGAITSSGLYTPPSSVTTEYTVIVTARSQADPAKVASATVTLVPVGRLPPRPSAPLAGVTRPLRRWR